MDDLNVLTEEIVKIAEDMEKDMKMANNIVSWQKSRETRKEKVTQSKFSSDSAIPHRRGMSSMCTQTEIKQKPLKKYEVASQTDTE